MYCLLSAILIATASFVAHAYRWLSLARSLAHACTYNYFLFYQWIFEHVVCMVNFFSLSLLGGCITRFWLKLFTAESYYALASLTQFPMTCIHTQKFVEFLIFISVSFLSASSSGWCVAPEIIVQCLHPIHICDVWSFNASSKPCGSAENKRKKKKLNKNKTTTNKSEWIWNERFMWLDRDHTDSERSIEFFLKKKQQIVVRVLISAISHFFFDMLVFSSALIRCLQSG